MDRTIIEKINPRLTVPDEVNWQLAVDRFNDEDRRLDDYENGGSKLCPYGDACRECNPSGDCYHCILDMQYYSSGNDIYPATKRAAFATCAGRLGYTITRTGYEQFNCKNPTEGVLRI